MTDERPKTSEERPSRSLIVDVPGNARGTEGKRREGSSTDHAKKPTWYLICAAGAVCVVGFLAFEVWRSSPSARAREISSCRDVDGAVAAVRETVDTYARETEALQFRQRHLTRHVRTEGGCQISVYGEIRATWPDGTATNETFDATATPARDGSPAWFVDGPFFYDQADDEVVQ